jgi:hypothetical protein
MYSSPLGGEIIAKVVDLVGLCFGNIGGLKRRTIQNRHIYDGIEARHLSPIGISWTALDMY